MSRPTQRLRPGEGAGERGSAALEAVLIAPIFVLLFMFAVFGGRIAGAKNHVLGAAQDAARAASLRQDVGTAPADAARTADASLHKAGLSCASQDVNVDTGELRPGGLVVVRVTCTARLSDLTLLGVPGSRTFSATATEPVDTYRSDQP
jgi:Flp pilus assembly protein TadG